METEVEKLYEAMFLVDSAEAASDWDGINETIRRILQRRDAQIEVMRKWNEGRLAYEISGKERGTYILVYFRAAGDAIEAIERDVQLSERILRVLIVRADHIDEQVLEKEKTIMAEKPSAEEEKTEQKTESKPEDSPAETAVAAEQEQTED